ncbi:MAG TPA: hypothetical protein VMV59_07880 [Candidatus Dormibacteraeota bacterium]|nr:hypothetical protein [Candidatus Dormibacteraeota bacterium]
MRKVCGIAIALCSAVLWAGAQPAFAQYGPGGMAGAVHDVDRPNDVNAIPPEQVLSANPNLAAKFQAMLPTDVTAMDAAKGYNNLHNFAAAVHASHDLNLPFPQFKCTELGGKYCTPETKAKGMNLGKTIQTLKPDMAKADVKNAEKQANKEAKNDKP